MIPLRFNPITSPNTLEEIPHWPAASISNPLVETPTNRVANSDIIDGLRPILEEDFIAHNLHHLQFLALRGLLLQHSDGQW